MCEIGLRASGGKLSTGCRLRGSSAAGTTWIRRSWARKSAPRARSLTTLCGSVSGVGRGVDLGGPDAARQPPPGPRNSAQRQPSVPEPVKVRALSALFWADLLLIELGPAADDPQGRHSVEILLSSTLDTCPIRATSVSHPCPTHLVVGLLEKHPNVASPHLGGTRCGPLVVHRQPCFPCIYVISAARRVGFRCTHFFWLGQARRSRLCDFRCVALVVVHGLPQHGHLGLFLFDSH